MNKQRKVLITITYNEMGIIIDTKAEEVAQPTQTNADPMQGSALDCVRRQQAIDTMCEACSDWCDEGVCKKVSAIQKLPSEEPEPSTAYWKKDVFGTVICSKCGGIRRDNRVDHIQWCNSCGCYMRGEQNE